MVYSPASRFGRCRFAPSQDRVGHVCAAKTGTTVRFRGRPRPQGYAKKESPSGYWGGRKLQWKGYPNECAITKPDDGGTARRTLREGEEDHPEQAHARLGADAGHRPRHHAG
ncbi:MAG: hypothetical protein EGR18_10575, partial [Bifidobacterium breve]|nr:hypothetical protein [Bifidobacterium breve]